MEQQQNMGNEYGQEGSEGSESQDAQNNSNGPSGKNNNNVGSNNNIQEISLDDSTGNDNPYNKDELPNDNKPSMMQQASNVLASTTDNIKNALGYYLNNVSIVYGLLFVIVLCAFVGWGLYTYTASALYNQSKIVIEETKIPILCNQPNQYSVLKFNKTGNGLRRTYTFWIYLNDMTKYNGVYKHVWHIGDGTNDITVASPFVFLDSTQNKLYFRFGSLSTDILAGKYSTIANIQPSDLANFMAQGITIDYIPLQRWVHIAVVINENANGGNIIAYVDGDISKIINTGDNVPGTNKQFNLTNLNIDMQGSLFTGGGIGTAFGVGFSGLISKVTLFNYDLNDRDIYKNYNEGPVDGLIALLGLGKYGFRSPVYRIA